MKHFAYLSIFLFHCCWGANQEPATTIVLNKHITKSEPQTKSDATANHPTYIWFFIENIDTKSHQAEISWGEENAKCPTPFKREYKETWQLKSEDVEQLKTLDPQQNHDRLWALISRLANTQSIKIKFETITDDTMVSFST